MNTLQSPLSLQHHSSAWALLLLETAEVMHDVLASLCNSLDLFLPSSGTASVLDSPWLVLLGGCSCVSEGDC